MSAKKKESIRWTVERAAAEFGIDRRTLSKRLVAESIDPASDACFSTKQICQAIFSAKEVEETLLTRAKREREEIKLAQDRQQLIPTEMAVNAWAGVVVPMRTTVLSSNLTETEKTDLLAQLRDIPISEYFAKRSTADAEEGDDDSLGAV